MLTFNQLGLIAPILQALEQQCYTLPTPIQQQAIPSVLQQKDLLGCAQTGTGKTAAFAIPVLQLLSHPSSSAVYDKSSYIKTLVLTPTRELAIQIHDSFLAYGQFLRIQSTVIFGGVSQVPQVEQLKKGTDILIATPGRLLDLIQQGFINLKQLQILVLDEADRMLDMGFIHDVKKILQLLPVKKQTLFFSATMPKEIADLANTLLHNPVVVKVTPVSSTADTVKQELFMVDKKNKQALLSHLINETKMNRVLVFSRTKHGADRIAKNLKKQQITADAIHGDKSQTARQRALQLFRDNKLTVLVASDIAARGIDIDHLTHVINFDLPNVPETYVHRIGRTGRAGESGIAFSFCDKEEVQYLKDIVKLIGKKIPVTQHPFTMNDEAITQAAPQQKKSTINNNTAYKRRK